MFEVIVVLVLVFSVIWAVIALFLFKSDSGNGKRKSIAGFMLFGPAWPLISNSLIRKMSIREQIGLSCMLVLCFGALIYVFSIAA